MKSVNDTTAAAVGRKPIKVGPGTMATIRSMFLKGASVRAIGREVGLSKNVVRNRLAPLIAELKGKQELPATAKSGRERRALPENFALTVRQGMTRSDLRKHFNTSLDVVARWLADTGLSAREIPKNRRSAPEDFVAVAPTMFKRQLLSHYSTSSAVLERWLAECPHVRTRSRAGKLRQQVVRSSSVKDALFGRIDALVPRAFADDIRSDIISDLYVAVLEGVIPENELEALGGAIMNRTISDCGASRFSKTMSLNERLSDDSETTLGDTLIDPAALQAFDHIFEEAL
ncbi:hypothetical protein [Sphingopyxis macrogoltabida]|uniref:Uncharacterized protein n=1 Tax=Sphingopyxis macrogoltabida TaxID=33050 RepID=A0AAC9AVL4_SPHMC|nr:hypothetical protein [Sphingopyxis macrogoltabida]ALJ14093.1 hypothetical protein LH19_14560 [Sphingopyxis macrogoltabida]AMU90364.1 hypothetical protein ATM17_15160 [Sphingopyxis macrogoltabida]